MGRKIDLKDRRFGRLVVIGEAGQKWGRIFWRCQCDCGNKKIIDGGSLRNGFTKSCGCLLKEATRKRMTTHSMSKTSSYSVWAHIIQRCTDQNCVDYDYYGGRGIAVCKKWLNFENFFEDMGKRPEGLTIERINNELGYFKENCRWATRTEQARNQRIQKNNTSGTKSVCWNKQRQKYQARITVNKNRYCIGFFTNLEKAAKARKQAEQKHW